MKLIGFTNNTNESIYINPEYVAALEDAGRDGVNPRNGVAVGPCTCIYTTGKAKLLVLGNIEEVATKLGSA